MAEHRTAAVMEALASVYDPCCQEKGLSVVDMGLVRKVDLDGDQARVELLLTTGWCPFAANLVGQISERVAALPGMAGSTVEIVWDEPWTTDRLSDKARRTLRFLPHPKEVGPLSATTRSCSTAWPTSSTSRRRTPWGRRGRCSSITCTPSTTP